MDTAQEVGGNPGPCRVAHPAELERQLDVARGGEPGRKGRLLEDEGHVTVDVGPSARRLLESGEEVEQRALAGAGGADHADELSSLDLEAHTLQGHQETIAMGVGHGKRLDAKGMLLGKLEYLAHGFAPQWRPHSLTSPPSSHPHRPPPSSSPPTPPPLH